MSKKVSKKSVTVEWVEGGASGLTHVHEEGSCSLEKALRMMRGETDKVLMAKAPTHIFRGVVPTQTPSETEELTDKVCSNFLGSFVQQSIRPTVDDGVFINDHDGPAFAGDAEGLKSVLRETGENLREQYGQLLSLADMESVYDAIISDIASGSLKPYYGQNMTDVPDKIKIVSKLSNLPFLINKETSDLNPSHGINITTFYQAMLGALSPVHREDGRLDSGNVVVSAEGRKGHFSKLWLVINPLDNQTFIDGICDVLDKQRKRDERDAKEWLEGCCLPVGHKKLFVRPSFCGKLGVTYQIFGQKAGDLVYVAPNVFHQVINLDVNLAEAVNIGSPSWQVGNVGFGVCRCAAVREKRGVSTILSNPSVVITASSHKVAVYDCTRRFCRTRLRTKAELEQHLQMPHRRATAGKISRKLYKEKSAKCNDVVYCAECNKSYTSKKNLQQHFRRCHESQERYKKACVTCGKMYHTSNMAKHIRSHEKNPSNDGILRCEKCGKVFQKPQGLGVHRVSCSKTK